MLELAEPNCGATTLGSSPSLPVSLAVSFQFGMVERKDCPGWVCSVQRHPGLLLHCSSVIHVFRLHFCLLLLHSSPCPWVWLQLRSSSGWRQSRVMAAVSTRRVALHPWGGAAGQAGVCGGRAAPEGSCGTPGLEGQPGAGTVWCTAAVSPCLGNKQGEE